MNSLPPEGYFAQIGNYYVGETIGRGTFGKVKMGMHVFTMQKVAIKILDKDKIVDEADKQRVAREIQILRKIRHPNIIQLFEVTHTIEDGTVLLVDGTTILLFLITEYATNNELFNYIVKRNRLTERQSARFLMQILNAVEYLHENGITHRDLKPENLLLDYTDSIKVADFGLSNMYAAGETLSTACGSPCYAAPEMVSGKHYDGLKTDIWSCGVVVYAMICGFLPFEDKNTPELYKKIINSPLSVPEFLSETAANFLQAILHKDPWKRLSINEIRSHDFCVKNSNQPILRGITFGRDEILIDPLILSLIRENFDVDIDAAKTMIQNNKHNQITSTYYLLLNNHIRKGGVSVADLSRPHPVKKLLVSNNNPPKTQSTVVKPTIQDFEEAHRKEGKSPIKKVEPDTTTSVTPSTGTSTNDQAVLKKNSNTNNPTTSEVPSIPLEHTQIQTTQAKKEDKSISPKVDNNVRTNNSNGGYTPAKNKENVMLKSILAQPTQPAATAITQQANQHLQTEPSNPADSSSPVRYRLPTRKTNRMLIDNNNAQHSGAKRISDSLPPPRIHDVLFARVSDAHTATAATTSIQQQQFQPAANGNVVIQSQEQPTSAYAKHFANMISSIANSSSRRSDMASNRGSIASSTKRKVMTEQSTTEDNNNTNTPIKSPTQVVQTVSHQKTLSSDHFSVPRRFLAVQGIYDKPRITGGISLTAAAAVAPLSPKVPSSTSMEPLMMNSSKMTSSLVKVDKNHSVLRAVTPTSHQIGVWRPSQQPTAFFANNPNANQSIVAMNAKNIINTSMPDASAATINVSPGKRDDSLQYSQQEHSDAISMRKKLRQISQRSFGGNGVGGALGQYKIRIRKDGTPEVMTTTTAAAAATQDKVMSGATNSTTASQLRKTHVNFINTQNMSPLKTSSRRLVSSGRDATPTTQSSSSSSSTTAPSDSSTSKHMKTMSQQQQQLQQHQYHHERNYMAEFPQAGGHTFTSVMAAAAVGAESKRFGEELMKKINESKSRIDSESPQMFRRSIPGLKVNVSSLTQNNTITNNNNNNTITYGHQQQDVLLENNRLPFAVSSQVGSNTISMKSSFLGLTKLSMTPHVAVNANENTNSISLTNISKYNAKKAKIHATNTMTSIAAAGGGHSPLYIRKEGAGS